MKRVVRCSGAVLMSVPLVVVQTGSLRAAQMMVPETPERVALLEAVKGEGAALARPQGKTVIRAQQPKVQTGLSSLRMTIDGMRLEGDVGVDQAAVQEVLKPWAGRTLSFIEYEQAVHAVAQYLRENGHPGAEVKVSRAEVNGSQIAVAIQGLTIKPVTAVASVTAPAADPASAQGAQAVQVAQTASQATTVAAATAAAQPGTAASAQETVAAVAEPVVTPAPVPVPEPLPPVQTEPRIRVDRFVLDGVQGAAQETLKPVVQAYEGRALTVAELNEVSAKVAAELRAMGFGLAQAFLPPQRVDGGEIKISVQQGVVDPASTVAVGGDLTRVPVQKVQSLLDQAVQPGQPLDTTRLDKALRVAGEIPGIQSVKASLQPGEQAGTTKVAAVVEPTSLVNGMVWTDNHGSRYVGTQRVNALVQLNSPSGAGEQYAVNYSRSTGMSHYKLSGQGLVGEQGLKLGASWSEMKMDLGLDVADLALNSRAQIWSVYGSFPLLRGPRTNITLAANWDDKRLNNSIVGALIQERKVQGLTFGGQGDTVDGLNGQWAWNAFASVAKLDLPSGSDAKAVDDQSARTQGQFAKLNASASRTAYFRGAPGWSVYTGVNAQWSSRNLDGSEKFQLGGPTGVRAYPVGEGLGDQGWVGTAEVRYAHQLSTDWHSTWSLFYDVGGLLQYRAPWQHALAEGRPNQYTLSGYGVGLQLNYRQQAQFKLIYAEKSGVNPNQTPAKTDSDGRNRSGRLWVIGTISF